MKDDCLLIEIVLSIAVIIFVSWTTTVSDFQRELNKHLLDWRWILTYSQMQCRPHTPLFFVHLYFDDIS